MKRIFFLLLINSLLMRQINCGQQDELTLGKAAFAVVSPVATQALNIGLDKLNIRTTLDNKQIEQYGTQMGLNQEQTIQTQVNTKTGIIQHGREKLAAIEYERDALVKHYARPENKNMSQEKEIAFAMNDIDFKAATDGRQELKKQKSIIKNGEVYMEMKNELNKLNEDPEKNKKQIDNIKNKMNEEIKNKLKAVKKEHKKKIEIEKEEKTKEIEKKYQDIKDKNKQKEANKTNKTSLFTKITGTLVAATELAGKGLDIVADKSFALITNHDYFKGTFVATNAKNINRALVVASAAICVYGLHKLYKKYTIAKEDIYDNDADDDDDE